MDSDGGAAFTSQFIEHLNEGPGKLREVLSALSGERPCHALGGDFVRHRAFQKSKSIAAGKYKRDEDSSDDEDEAQAQHRQPVIEEEEDGRELEDEADGGEHPHLEQLDGQEALLAWTYQGLTGDGGIILDFLSPQSPEHQEVISPFEKIYEEMKLQAKASDKDATASASAFATICSNRPPNLGSLTISEVDVEVTDADLKTFNATLSRAIKQELRQTMSRKATTPSHSSYASAATTTEYPLLTPLGLDRVVSDFEDCLDDDDLVKKIQVDFLQDQIKPLNLVLMIVGTRGDVQPFVGIALKLKEYGHRVRIATHKVFREFVTGFGLEFFPLGGDPKVLSEFVVKHRGIWPGLDISGVIEQKAQLKEIVRSVYQACTEPDPQGGVQGGPGLPFTADAVVANPAAYGAGMCAEKLKVPFHVVFTMPWNPTGSFPHPFARMSGGLIGNLLDASSKAAKVANWMSYFAVDQLAWLGPADYLVKLSRSLELKFHKKIHGPHCLHYSKVPFTYIWSPALVPRPEDWPAKCEVVGFVNLDLKQLTAYTPPKEIVDFLAAGTPPIYIGFGSLVVDNPAKLTRRFLKALKATNQRAIIQKGWGGLGAGVEPGSEPGGVLFIGPAAHDWLFPRCSAVVHHGGAGTTACGLYCGKPTFIVPFFGDQPFWGAACFRAGLGPAPVAIDALTSSKIIAAFEDLILPERRLRAEEIMALMLRENGADGAVDHIHRSIYGALLGHESELPWMQESYHVGDFISNLSVPNEAYVCEEMPEDLQLNKLKSEAKKNPDAKSHSAPASILGTIISAASRKKTNSIEVWSSSIHSKSHLSQRDSTNPFESKELLDPAVKSGGSFYFTPSQSDVNQSQRSGTTDSQQQGHEVPFIVGSDRLRGKMGGLFTGNIQDFANVVNTGSRETVMRFKKIGQKSWLLGALGKLSAGFSGFSSSTASDKSGKKLETPVV